MRPLLPNTPGGRAHAPQEHNARALERSCCTLWRPCGRGDAVGFVREPLGVRRAHVLEAAVQHTEAALAEPPWLAPRASRRRGQPVWNAWRVEHAARTAAPLLCKRFLGARAQLARVRDRA